MTSTCSRTRPASRSNPTPGFNTGLYTSNGQPKATAEAFRLPLWLPRTRSRRAPRPRSGAAPVRRRSLRRSASERSRSRCRRAAAGTWTTIQTVSVSKTTGYFDIHPKLPYSGKLRLAYTYPQSEPLLPTGVAGSTIYSRTVTVKVSG